jgi:hypothetical protein
MLWACGANAFAGVHLSTEPLADLPAQWRGFLLDHRALRMIAVPAQPNQPATLLREQYADTLTSLERALAQRPGTADEWADVGALLIRLGHADRAIERLRPAVNQHPQHFRLISNLGTAWHVHGDLAQAQACLEAAVRLAPAEHKRLEELHLRLIRQRLAERRPGTQIDDLFGVRYVGPLGGFAAGQWAPTERAKLPADAPGLLQRLALRLPTDGRLLWQLAALANAQGDVRTAASMLDGCVSEFALSYPDLRHQRQLVRAAVPERPTAADAPGHAPHAGIVFRSPRPLARHVDLAKLPIIQPNGINPLPWAVLTQTTIDRHFRPTFVDYLRQLDGKQVALLGFMQPLQAELEVRQFLLIEYPVGCWFCETPEPTGLVYIELAAGTVQPVRRGLVKVEGQLRLNSRDPEDFLFTLRQAKLGVVD